MQKRHARTVCLKCGEEFTEARQYDAHLTIVHEFEDGGAYTAAVKPDGTFKEPKKHRK